MQNLPRYLLRRLGPGYRCPLDTFEHNEMISDHPAAVKL